AGVHTRDRGLSQLAQGALGALGGGLQIGQRMQIGARVVAMLPAESLGDVGDHYIVPIFAAQVNIAFDGQRLKVTLRQPNQRYVERAAAEVVDEDGALLVG